MPSFPVIPDAASLHTDHADTTTGFIRMALRRNQEATRHMADARALQAAAAALPTAQALLAESSLQKALLTAAGVSAKANKHFSPADRQKAVAEFVEAYLTPVQNFPEELAFRFLLTQGDALGGAMRNIVGKLGEEELLRALLAALRIHGMAIQRLPAKGKRWEVVLPTTVAPENGVRALAWQRSGQARVLLLNQKVPVINKNIDLVLLRAVPAAATTPADRTTLLADPAAYLAFGELKGGVDPAGADEHWKTARTAFERIRGVFAEAPTFFVGGAIERSMATEIWRDLQANKLHYAANLTHDAQVAALANWLVTQ